LDSWIGDFAESLIEPLQRTLKVEENVAQNQAMSAKRKGGWKKGDGVHALIGGDAGGGGEGREQSLLDLVYEISSKLEEKIGTLRFLEATTAVKSRMVNRNTERKKEESQIKLTDAKLYSEMRRMKNEGEKKRKRKNFEKKRSMNPNDKRVKRR